MPRTSEITGTIFTGSSGDIANASDVSVIPVGDMVSTNVQAATQELDAELTVVEDAVQQINNIQDLTVLFENNLL